MTVRTCRWTLHRSDNALPWDAELDRAEPAAFRVTVIAADFVVTT